MFYFVTLFSFHSRRFNIKYGHGKAGIWSNGCISLLRRSFVKYPFCDECESLSVCCSRRANALRAWEILSMLDFNEFFTHQRIMNLQRYHYRSTRSVGGKKRPLYILWFAYAWMKRPQQLLTLTTCVVDSKVS